jgi:hypothetical protein
MVFINEIEVVYAALTLLSIIWLCILIKKDFSFRFGTFQKQDSRGKNNAKEILQIAQGLFKQYSKQQNWAFGLVWFAIAWSLILGTYLIISIIQKKYGIVLLAKGIGLAGGVGISISAFRLYNKSSKKIEDLFKDLSKRT